MASLPAWGQPLVAAAESVEASAVMQASVVLAAAPVVPVGAAVAAAGSAAGGVGSITFAQANLSDLGAVIFNASRSGSMNDSPVRGFRILRGLRRTTSSLQMPGRMNVLGASRRASSAREVKMALTFV